MESNPRTEEVTLAVAAGLSTSGSVGIPEWWPSGHRVGVVLSHDAGSNKDQELLVRVQDELVRRGYLSIRYNFPYAQQNKKRPDPLPLLEKTLRAAVAALLRDPQTAPAQILLAGAGLGARVAAQGLAHGLKADALICLGFPLHPSGKPSQQKSDFLFRLICPVLFVQGTRDPYCRIDRLESLLRRIGAPTQLAAIEDADHSLAVIKRSWRSAEDVQAEVRRAVVRFLEQVTRTR